MADVTNPVAVNEVADKKEEVGNPVSPKAAEKGEVESKDEEPEGDKETIKKEAELLYLQGKRDLIIGDFNAAVEKLADCVQKCTQCYAEDSDEMADKYFCYGRALFELAREEAEALEMGQKAEGNGEEEETIEEEDEEAEETEKKEENGDKNEMETETENEDEKVDGEVGKNGESNDNEESEKADDEITDFQLSWEYLELARNIYSKKATSSKEDALKLADCYLYLGQNSMESDCFSRALEDLTQGLELLLEHLPQGDRRIAEMYYQMGVANAIGEEYDQAIAKFQSAIDQLKKAITSLEEQKASDKGKKVEEEMKEKNPFYTIDGEIDDIKKAIDDIQIRINDMHDHKTQKDQIKAEIVKQVFTKGSSDGASTSSAGESGAGSSSSSSTAAPAVQKPANDISHLIRKKRKNEEEEANQDKKAKTDETK